MRWSGSPPISAIDTGSKRTATTSSATTKSPIRVAPASSAAPGTIGTPGPTLIGSTSWRACPAPEQESHEDPHPLRLERRGLLGEHRRGRADRARVRSEGSGDLAARLPRRCGRAAARLHARPAREQRSRDHEAEEREREQRSRDREAEEREWEEWALAGSSPTGS